MVGHTQGDPKSLTEVDIRIFIRDRDPDMNELLDDLEFTKEEIQQAQTLCVDRFNDFPPMIGRFTINTFPFRYYFLVGTCANLFTMAAISYRRNKLNANITGGAVDPKNKDKDYNQAAVLLSDEFQKWMERAKAQMNMEQCWGSV